MCSPVGVAETPPYRRRTMKHTAPGKAARRHAKAARRPGGTTCPAPAFVDPRNSSFHNAYRTLLHHSSSRNIIHYQIYIHTGSVPKRFRGTELE
eukprot:12095543-Alexandrium_andersonii.AAC.1